MAKKKRNNNKKKNKNTASGNSANAAAAAMNENDVNDDRVGDNDYVVVDPIKNEEEEEDATATGDDTSGGGAQLTTDDDGVPIKVDTTDSDVKNDPTIIKEDKSTDEESDVGADDGDVPTPVEKEEEEEEEGKEQKEEKGSETIKKNDDEDEKTKDQVETSSSALPGTAAAAAEVVIPESKNPSTSNTTDDSTPSLKEDHKEDESPSEPEQPVQALSPSSNDGDDEKKSEHEAQPVKVAVAEEQTRTETTTAVDDVPSSVADDDKVVDVEETSKEKISETPVVATAAAAAAGDVDPSENGFMLESVPTDELPITAEPQPKEENHQDTAEAVTQNVDELKEKSVDDKPTLLEGSGSEKKGDDDEDGGTNNEANSVPSDEGVKKLSSTPGETETKPSPAPAPEPAKASTRRPTGMTFAAAFGSSPAPVISPLASPPVVVDVKPVPPSLEQSETPQSSGEDLDTPNSSSHSALSASRNKRVSSLLSKYVETVAHEPLPGDFVPLRRTNSNPSKMAAAQYSPSPSPSSLQPQRKMLDVDADLLPDMNSVREMFEESSKHSETNEFEFGESFRQKKRFEQLSGKAQEREAKAALHGFDQNEVTEGRTASGEIDTTSLAKIFTFELSSNESISLHDGSCKVNYKNVDYKAMVFVVHRTRGMLLLHVNMPDTGTTASGMTKGKKQIPGGSVHEDEFLRAAKQSGSSQVQLQIAAREAAARQLYQTTGLDIRHNVERFKPAVLKMHTKVDARGVQYPRNEHANNLYYFLQVDEDDFSELASVSATGLVRPSVDPGDSPLTLKLGSGYSDFTFVQDPSAAANVLKDGGENDATTALRMIINAAETEGGVDQSATGPADAKATVVSSKVSVAESAPADEKKGTLYKTIGDDKPKDDEKGEIERNIEADIKHKPSNDTADAVVAVNCCCGWW